MRFLIIILALAFVSCRKDSAEAYEPFFPLSCGDSIFFQSEVKGPIIDMTCNVTNCHNELTAANGIDYSTHTKIVPITHGLYKSMAHDSGFVPMPSAEVRVADSLLQKCYCWIQQGKQNN